MLEIIFCILLWCNFIGLCVYSSIIPNRRELHQLKLDKSIDYESLNNQQKRLCLRRLRLRDRYKTIADELEVINKELNK